MASAAKNKKFVHLEGVRVYHNKKDNSIQLISTDEDISGQPFQLTLHVGTESEETLRNLLIEKGTLTVEDSDPYNGIPKQVDYPERLRTEDRQIAFGVTENAGIVLWDTELQPHALLVGATGSGKSVLQRSVIMHCLTHPSWEIIGIDLKRVELSPYAQYPSVKEISVTLTDAVASLRKVLEQMTDRYRMMEEANVNSLDGLKNPDLKRIMVLVDEAHLLFASEGGSDDEAKARDVLRDEAQMLTGQITRLGRAAGVHFLIGTQHTETVSGELKANLDMRIGLSQMNSIESSMVFGSTEGTKIPRGVHGRGAYSANGEVKPFQLFWLSPSRFEAAVDAVKRKILSRKRFKK